MPPGGLDIAMFWTMLRRCAIHCILNEINSSWHLNQLSTVHNQDNRSMGYVMGYEFPVFHLYQLEVMVSRRGYIQQPWGYIQQPWVLDFPRPAKGLPAAPAPEEYICLLMSWTQWMLWKHSGIYQESRCWYSWDLPKHWKTCGFHEGQKQVPFIEIQWIMLPTVNQGLGPTLYRYSFPWQGRLKVRWISWCYLQWFSFHRCCLMAVWKASDRFVFYQEPTICAAGIPSTSSKSCTWYMPVGSNHAANTSYNYGASWCIPWSMDQIPCTCTFTALILKSCRVSCEFWRFISSWDHGDYCSSCMAPFTPHKLWTLGSFWNDPFFGWGYSMRLVTALALWIWDRDEQPARLIIILPTSFLLHYHRCLG